MMNHALVCAMMALLCAAGGCQLHPRPVDAGTDLPAPSAPPLPYHLSNMKVQTVRATPYFYSSIRTSFDEMEDPASNTVAILQKLTATGKVHSTGPILFVYHDPTENPQTPFEVDMGVPVFEKTPASDNFKIRDLPSFRCATIVYRGPLKHLARAYDKLIRDMITAGYVPSDEIRESHIIWEGPESSKNVVQIEVGIR